MAFQGLSQNRAFKIKMDKITDISFLELFKILCTFNNGEQRILDLTLILNDKYSKKICNEGIFKQAKVGSLGEIYWEGIAEIKDLNGNVIPCEYDISPEFAHMNSIPIENP